MAAEVGVKNSFYGYLQFPTYQGLSEKVARVANVVKDIAQIGLDIFIPWYHGAGYEGNSTFGKAMERAAWYRHTVALKFFLNRPGIQDVSLVQALKDAVKMGHLEVVNIILQDVQDKRGLFLDLESSNNLVIQLFREAVYYKRIEVAKFFIEQFPHPQLESYFLSLMKGNWQLSGGWEFENLKFLLECCDQTRYREPGIKQAFKTAFILADPSIIQYMLEEGFQISEEDCNEALSSIASRDHLRSRFRCIELLLPKSSQEGFDQALIASFQTSSSWFSPHLIRTFLQRSSQEGRKRALEMALTRTPSFRVLNQLLPSMPIPDRFLRAAIKRCWPNGRDGIEVYRPFSRENALKKGAKLLTFRVHVAKRLADSSKLVTGKAGLGSGHPVHLKLFKREMPVVMNRIFYGYQDLFNATHLLGEMH